MSDPQTPSAPPSPAIPLNAVLNVISSPARWRILREFASGDQLMVTEIAERTRQSKDVTSKHIGVLRAAGIVIQGRNRLYQIAPQFLADKTERLIDFGYCLLRLDTPA
jgi:DNA-binding transcriptional ArsR family regulator